MIRTVTGNGRERRSDDSSNGSVSFFCASDSANGSTVGHTIASIVPGTIIDSGVLHITVAGNSAVAMLFGGFLS